MHVIRNYVASAEKSTLADNVCARVSEILEKAPTPFSGKK